MIPRWLLLVITLLLMTSTNIKAQTRETDIFSENYQSNEEPFVNRTWTNRMLYELSETLNWKLDESTLETIGTSANTTYYYPIEQNSNLNLYEVYLFSGDIGGRQFVELKITPMIPGTLKEDERRFEIFETALRLLQSEVSDSELLVGYDEFLLHYDEPIQIGDVTLYTQGYSDEIIYFSRELTEEIDEGTYPNLASTVLQEQVNDVIFDEYSVHMAETKQGDRPTNAFEAVLPNNFFERAEENAIDATYLEAFQYFNWIIYDIYSHLPNYGETIAFDGEVKEIYPSESTLVLLLESESVEIADTQIKESYYIYLLTDEIELEKGDTVSGVGNFTGIETTESYTLSILAEEIMIEGQLFEIRTAGESE